MEQEPKNQLTLAQEIDRRYDEELNTMKDQGVLTEICLHSQT